MYQAGGGNGENRYGIIDAKPGDSEKVGEGALKLEGLRVEVDPPQEWKQMFSEVWRQERDFFFRAVHEWRGLGQRSREVRGAVALGLQPL